MKYLVNRETKEHKIANDTAIEVMERYQDFWEDFELVEADSEGWIPFNGLSNPLPEDCICEVRTPLSHPEVCQGARLADAWGWDLHRYDVNRIICYRPILTELSEREQQQTPCEKLGYKVGDRFVVTGNDFAGCEKWAKIILGEDDGTECPRFSEKGAPSIYAGLDSVTKVVDFEGRSAVKDDVFTRLRTATEHAASITAIIAEIDELLGPDYQVVRVEKIEAAAPQEDMSDWRNWKKGDVVKATKGTGDCYQKGALYTVRCLENETVCTMTDSKGSKTNGWHHSNFRFHSRPAGATK